MHPVFYTLTLSTLQNIPLALLLILPYPWPPVTQILHHQISPVQCNMQPDRLVGGALSCVCLPSLEKCNRHPGISPLPKIFTIYYAYTIANQNITKIFTFY